MSATRAKLKIIPLYCPLFLSPEDIATDLSRSMVKVELKRWIIPLSLSSLPLSALSQISLNKIWLVAEVT